MTNFDNNINPMARALVKSPFSTVTNNAQVSIDNVSDIKYSDWLETIPLPAMFASFPFDNSTAIIVIDSSLVYSMVDVLSGGRRGTCAMRIEGRPYTTIENRIINELVIAPIVNELYKAFTIIDTPQVNQENASSIVPLMDPNVKATIINFRVNLEDRGGRFMICINDE